MENITIKVHPPWYARGTPIINKRDGPPMANSDKPLFAIRGKPSARGKPKDKIRLWLTLKTTFFNTQNHVFSPWYALSAEFFDADRSEEEDAVRSEERSADAVDFDLSAYAVPDNVKMVEEDNVKMVEEDNVKMKWKKIENELIWNMNH